MRRSDRCVREKDNHLLSQAAPKFVALFGIGKCFETNVITMDSAYNVDIGRFFYLVGKVDIVLKRRKMKRTLRMAAIALLLAVSCVQCSKMDGPEAAAKNNFSEWAVNIRTPYRNESFETITTDGTTATVRITVEIKIDGKWTKKDIEIQCEKVDADWQCARWMQIN